MMYFILLSILIMCREVGLPHEESNNDLKTFEVPLEAPELTPVPFIEPLDCFEYAESITGFSAEILRGIAATETRFKTKAVGDGGMSFGMFQLHSRWYESRAKKWGNFDPTDPFESAVIAGRIMQENLTAFNGDLRMAIAAYRQGVSGVKENGIIGGYVSAVINWRLDRNKLECFSLFEEGYSKVRKWCPI
jgi:hypothetical protein